VALGEQFVEPGGDRFLVEARAGHVEVEPAPPVADRPAGHRAGHHRTQQMQAGVHAHQPVAALPIDLGGDRGARLGQRRARLGDMDHRVGRVTLHRIDDRDRRPVGQPQHPAIAGLSAAGRIEHGAIKRDAALVNPNHPRRARADISVVAEDEFGHQCPSNHGGVGKLRSLRNSGLNSFD
jgi:hypothetical protein